MTALASPSRRQQQQQASALQAGSLAARNALVLRHLPLAVAERFRGAVVIASAAARRFFPLVERDDLIQVAREALLRSVPRCMPGEPAEPYLRRCITGTLQHHLRDLSAWCECPAGSMRRAPALWATSASMSR